MLPAEYRISDENPRWTPHTAYYANFLAFPDNIDNNITNVSGIHTLDQATYNNVLWTKN